MTGFGRRVLLAGALTVAVAPITGIAVAGTATAPHFGPAVSLKLPLNAGPGVPIIESASCVGTGSCTLAGSYADNSGVGQAMAVTESGGHWARAIELTLPANRDPGIGALAGSVSCTRVGSCVAVGDYQTSSHFQGFTATESHGTWHRATQVRLPTNACHPTPSSAA